MAGYFSQETLDKLHLGRLRIKQQFTDLNGRYHPRSYGSERGRESHATETGLHAIGVSGTLGMRHGDQRQ